MSEIHYFQRYSQKENVVTNNTLLLFSRLYNYSPRKFKVFLNDLIDGVELDVGISFYQQQKGGNSTPDGHIKQSSLRIVIETKLSNRFNLGQLKNHLRSLSNERQQLLLSLSPSSPENGIIEKINNEIVDYNKINNTEIVFVNLTFDNVICKFKEVINEYETELMEVIEDFENFCSKGGLLKRSDQRLLAVTCGKTVPLNFKYDIYFDPAHRGHSYCTHLGIYSDKTIVGIGKIDKIVTANLIENELKSDSDLTPKQKDNIIGIIKDAHDSLGWNIGKDHKFFCVEKFYETKYVKESKHALLGKKYFNLESILGSEIIESTEAIAERLKGKAWK